jgi:hypothetical protein
LQQGATPSQLLSEGFRKSTVYKVAEALRSQRAPAPPSLITVELRPDRARYQPGEVAQLTFVLHNNSGHDLYIFQVGIRPEWIGVSEWMPTTVRKLLGAGDAITLRFTVPIPGQLPLGEKELFTGVQGQWVGPQSASPSNDVMWTNALILAVQRPLAGPSVFIVHSVSDMSQISRLEAALDDNGFRAIIADSETGDQAMNQTDFLVAVLTHPTRLATALQEIRAGVDRGKHLVLLRDTSLGPLVPLADADLPWTDVDFSRHDNFVVVDVLSTLTGVVAQRMALQKKEQQDALGAILLGVGALVAGIAIGRGISGTGG